MHYEDALDKFSLDVPSGEPIAHANCGLSKLLRTAEAGQTLFDNSGTLTPVPAVLYAGTMVTQGCNLLSNHTALGQVQTGKMVKARHQPAKGSQELLAPAGP